MNESHIPTIIPLVILLAIGIIGCILWVIWHAIDTPSPNQVQKVCAQTSHQPPESPTPVSMKAEPVVKPEPAPPRPAIEQITPTLPPPTASRAPEPANHEGVPSDGSKSQPDYILGIARALPGIIIGMILLVVFNLLFVTIPVWFLWNWLLPSIFGATTISIFQAFGLSVLCALLFKANPHIPYEGELEPHGNSEQGRKFPL